MGITYSSNTNQEGKIYNVNDDTSLVESPFISTETYNEIKNTNVIDTPLSESVQSNLSINANSFTPNSIDANSFSQNSINVNSYDEGNVNELFVKPSKSNEQNIKYEVSLGSFNTPNYPNSQNVILPKQNLNSEGVILSLDGFSNSYSIEQYNQQGGNIFDYITHSENSFDINEYRPMDIDDITKKNEHDDFTINSNDFINSVINDKGSRRNSSRKKSSKRRSSRKNSSKRRSSRKKSSKRRSSRKKSSRKKSSRKNSSRKKSSRRRSRKQKGGNSSESELNYNFSATSDELLSSPQVGGGNSSDSVSVNSESSDVDQFRITGMRILN